ncbi:MAG TPA: carbohydrate ABC transporter permease [Chloroflexota bacterium]|jgi:multiple sugar transport system permease protein|nr:carbohydrate ABC transporter permease [Chloroflexota bacterium]
MAHAWRLVVDRFFYYLALAFYLFLAIFPLYWMVMATLKDDYDLVDPTVSPFWFRRPLGLNHFAYLFVRTNFLVWLQNTFVIAACVLVITLAVCIPGAYALARLRFAGAENLSIAIFLTYLIPPILLFLPLAKVVSAQLHLVNTKWALVLVYPTFTIPFCMWLLMGFFKRVPVEIEEAALVDGCNRVQAVIRVVLPVSVAGILTISIFAFTLAMQDFIYALTFVSSSSQKPLTLGVPTELIRGDVFFWGELMAGALIAGLPVAFLYNFFLDYFVEGITGGAVK